MIDIKDSIKSLISRIYECQKEIMINRRFIRDLLLEGNGNNTSRLQNEIKDLQWKIIEFQKELSDRFQYSY